MKGHQLRPTLDEDRPTSPSALDRATLGFSGELGAALRNLRGALIEVITAVGENPEKPQDLARRFNINRNLTWRMTRVVTSPDLYAAVPQIPGPAGMGRFFDALGKAGAREDLLERAVAAGRQFERVVETHTGDRSTLQLMIDPALPHEARAEHCELVRKLAFQGNSGVLGVRAEAQLCLHLLTPSETPGWCDLVRVGGLIGFQRLRPNARCLLFRRERWSDRDETAERGRRESLDPAHPIADGVPFIGSFCSDPVPAVEVLETGHELQYELPPGPVGNTAAFTCIYGEIVRQVGPTFGEDLDEFMELGCNLVLPVRQLVYDLLVHRDLAWAMSPQLVIYSRMDGDLMHDTERRERNELEIPARLDDLGFGAGAIATTAIPHYSNLIRQVVDRLGHDVNDFRTLRLTLTYPFIPSAALMRSPLPLRSAGIL